MPESSSSPRTERQLKIAYLDLTLQEKKYLRYTGLLAPDKVIHIELLAELWRIPENEAQHIAYILTEKGFLIQSPCVEEEVFSQDFYLCGETVQQYARKLLIEEGEERKAFKHYCSAITNIIYPVDVTEEDSSVIASHMPQIIHAANQCVLFHEEYSSMSILTLLTSVGSCVINQPDLLFADDPGETHQWWKTGIKLAEKRERLQNGCWGLLIRLLGTYIDPVNFITTKGSFLYYLGHMNEHQNRNRESLAYYQNAIDTLSETDSQKVRINAMRRMGSIYRYEHSYEEASQIYQTALNLSRKIENVEKEAQVLHNIGHLLYDTGKVDDALLHFKQSASMMHKIKCYSDEIRSLCMIGAIYQS